MLKVDSVNNRHVYVRVNHVAGVSYVNDLHAESKESVTKRLQAFFDVESLGIHCNPKCGNCKCGKCPLGSNKYSVRGERAVAHHKRTES